VNREEHPAEAVLREINRRRVGRVALGYLAVAFAVMEGAAAFLSPLHAPDWAFRAVLGVVTMGFPLATVLAWDFDITARGIVRTPEEPEGPVEELPVYRWALFVAFWFLVGLAIRLVA
jgi:adenine/guanine phosphoribosyltransferase-like PRPP-binding protein